MNNNPIVSDNGLALNKQQVIVWTNEGSAQFNDAYLQHSVSMASCQRM